MFGNQLRVGAAHHKQQEQVSSDEIPGRRHQLTQQSARIRSLTDFTRPLASSISSCLKERRRWVCPRMMLA